MSQAVAIWLVIVVAAVAANLPFLTERLFLLGASMASASKFGKPLYWRLLELVLLYFLVGALALLLEKRAGQITPQGWEFYAITATLFLTLAFPGFVYRYLMRRGGWAEES